jgi:hypothetical protein
MVIRCDKQGAISLTKNPTQHAQTKHIDVQHTIRNFGFYNYRLQLKLSCMWHMQLQICVVT